MARVTINKVNERIRRYGFNLLHGDGYYYFCPVSNNSPSIAEEGIYGTTLLNAWTIDQLEIMLVERIMDIAPVNSDNVFFWQAEEFTKKQRDNK